MTRNDQLPPPSGASRRPIGVGGGRLAAGGPGAPIAAGPLTRARWPAPRASAGLLAALAAVLAIAVLVGLSHRPSASQRAADLTAVTQALQTGIESCAGGLRDSLTALDEIQRGASRDRATALRIARDGAANCSPANNQQLADLTQYQVPESVAHLRLQTAVDDLVSWAFPSAQQVQQDVVNILSSGTAGGGTPGAQALQADVRQLDARRASVDQILAAAARSVGARESPLALPG